MKTYVALLAIGTVALSSLAGLPAPKTPPPAPYGVLPSERQVRHAEIEQYAFIHLTLNTFTDKEWGFGDEKPQQFNPTAFDADQIAGIFQEAGMQGVVLTCKHHDGFCLWPTKTTGHNISKSPYKQGGGDLVKDIAEAARRHGMKFGVYLSPWDRNSALYGKPEYVTEVYRGQARELLSNYGEIFELWLDGANGGDGYYGGARERRNIDRRTYYDWPATWAMVRQLQPGACIFSDVGPDLRWVGNESGYALDPCWATYTPVGPDGTPESAGPGQTRHEDGQRGTRNGKFWIPAEVDVSIRPGWFWHERENAKVKPPRRLWKIYLESVGRGASLILNVPPDRRGIVHENDAASLRAFGRALKATYATNFAEGARFEASNVRGNDAGWGAERLVDSDRWSAWITDDAVTTPSVELTLKKASTFNFIRLREDIRLGQRVEGVAVDARVDGGWKELGRAQSIGSCRLWQIPAVTTDKVRLRVTQSPVCPALSDFGLYLAPELPEMGFAGQVRPQDRRGWQVTASFQAEGNSPQAAIDGDPQTFWHTHDSRRGESGLPQSLTLDLGREKTLKGFTALPRQDGTRHGMVDRYRAETSLDGKTWQKAAEGEFSNIGANPIEQTVLFSQPTKARYLRLTALHAVERNHASFAEIGIVE